MGRGEDAESKECVEKQNRQVKMWQFYGVIVEGVATIYMYMGDS